MSPSTGSGIVVGAHADADPLAHAVAGGFSIVQTFIGDPQAWKGHAVDHPGGAVGGVGAVEFLVAGDDHGQARNDR